MGVAASCGPVTLRVIVQLEQGTANSFMFLGTASTSARPFKGQPWFCWCGQRGRGGLTVGGIVTRRVSCILSAW